MKPSSLGIKNSIDETWSKEKIRECQEYLEELVDDGIKSFVLYISGGKEASVLLTLIDKAIKASKKKLPKPLLLFLDSGKEIPEVLENINDLKKEWNLLTSTSNWRESVMFAFNWLNLNPSEHNMNSKNLLETEVVFVYGLRNTDPEGIKAEKSGIKYSPYSLYSINIDCNKKFNKWMPLYTWTLNEIWQFIRVYNINVCSLYFKGYSSLGTFGSTIINNALLNKDGTFAPPWQAIDNDRESRLK